jgi:hypothetical protein
MNKNLIIIVVAVLLLLGGGVFLMTSKKPTPANNSTAAGSSNVTNEASPSPEATTQSKSLKDLLGMGVSQKCTFAKNDNGSSTQGTIYIDNGQVRGDIVTVNGGQTVNTHMVVKNSTSYVWMEGQSNGFKMTFDPNAAASAQAKAQNNSVDPNEKVDYSCSGWSADTSVFSLPSSVTFSDFSKMAIPSITVPQTGSGIPGGVDKCAACNYLSGAAKTQCLSALNCQ